ncbi:MAG: hypothetical protein ACO4AY_10580 [Ilumatobacteraceae bacterium]
MTIGFRCAVCGRAVDIAQPFAWRCPSATSADPHHVLHRAPTGEHVPSADALVRLTEPGANPFLVTGPYLAWWAFAESHGMSAADCGSLTLEVAGDFRVTPFGRSAALSGELGLDLWVKDETGNVAGSHKARHLVSILLHLRAAE